MARYIDANALLRKMRNTSRYFYVKYDIEAMPTADVVPKSEVERLQEEIETLKDNNEHLAVMLTESKQEVAREIFEEIRKRAYSERGFFVVNSGIDDFIAELKKKYTEGESE